MNGQVTYSIERTVQIRQFEPLKIIVSLTDSVREGESNRDAFKRVFTEVDAAFGNRMKLIQDDSR